MKISSIVLAIFFIFFPWRIFGSAQSQQETNPPLVFRSDQAIVIDWDDTILPTSFVRGNFRVENSYENNLKSVLELCPDEWKEFDSFVSKFLLELSRTSILYVISNAEIIWIKLSSSILMPSTNQIIGQIERERRLISAKEFYFRAKQIPYQVENIEKTIFDWKSYTFGHVLSSYNMIISLGDSDFERTALNSVPNFREKEMIKKGLKLLDSPETIELLLTQWKLIRAKWKDFIKEEKTVDLYISEDINEFLVYE